MEGTPGYQAPETTLRKGEEQAFNVRYGSCDVHVKEDKVRYDSCRCACGLMLQCSKRHK